MKKNKNINFAENPIHKQILFIKQKKNQFFLISLMFEISFNKKIIDILILLKILSIQ